MDDTTSSSKTSFCYSCLCKNTDMPLQHFQLQNETLKTIFQVDEVILCVICKQIAVHTEAFIQNVQSNQVLLENLEVMTESTIETLKSSILPVMKLSVQQLEPLFLDGDDTSSNDIVVYGSKLAVEIKLECKDESDNNEIMNDLENMFSEYDEADRAACIDLDSQIKEEDELPLKRVKHESKLEEIIIKVRERKKRRKTVKKLKANKNIRIKKKAQLNNEWDVPGDKIELLHFTEKECLEERCKKLLEETYTNSEFKCADCVRGFSFRSSFESHLERHSKSNGKYICNICRQRTSTAEKLKSHKKYHTQRFRCVECGLTRVHRASVSDHYRSAHAHALGPGARLHCAHCFKTFLRASSLRKHVSLVHRARDKVVCAHCNKLFASKETLKAHVFRCHSQEGSAHRERRHACGQCDARFESPSQLRNHSIKHLEHRDYYCVECDKSFKSDNILKHHLKTTKTHNKDIDLPLSCLRCPMRFAIRRDLDRHTNRVHLNIKPFQCDQCDKAYINNWSLKEHRRMKHEGYKRPLKFPCPMCDKVFDRNNILKSHIRTHTGERPYQCQICPAAFSQAGILGTHMKLVHLRLTRDGRPRQQAAAQ